MAYRTSRALTLRAWDHRGMQGDGAPEFTLPAGSAAILVRGLSGTTGDGFAAGSVRQLAELTGNAHDAAHRYVTLPADAIEGDTEAERAEIARIIAAHGLSESLALAERVRLAQAAPAMLAALQDAETQLEQCEGLLDRDPELSAALAKVQAAIAAATGAPTGEGGAAVPTVAIRAGEYQLEPSASGEGFTLSRQSGAYGMRRHISADKLAATLAALDHDTGRTVGDFSQDDMGQEFTCTACGRAEDECSAEPCAAVIEDRES